MYLVEVGWGATVFPQRIHAPVPIDGLLLAGLLQGSPQRLVQDQPTDRLAFALDALGALDRVLLVHEVVLVELDYLLLYEGLDVGEVFGLFFAAACGHPRLRQGQQLVAIADAIRSELSAFPVWVGRKARNARLLCREHGRLR